MNFESYSHSGISTLRLEIGTLGFFQCFCDVYEHTKPLGISSKYYGWGFLIGGWITVGLWVGLWVVVVYHFVLKKMKVWVSISLVKFIETSKNM